MTGLRRALLLASVVNRWTTSWGRIEQTMAIGRADMESAVRAALEGEGNVFVGRHAHRYRVAVEGD
jgi:hypothetical protein